MKLRKLSKDERFVLIVALVFVAIFVFALGPEFLHKNRLYLSVTQVCGGTGVPETEGFSTETDIHPAIVLVLDDRSQYKMWKRFNGDLNQGWTPETLGEVQLVLCIGEKEVSTYPCTVETTIKATLSQLVSITARKSKLFDARTGQMLWSGLLTEEGLPCANPNISKISSAKEIRLFLEELTPQLN